MTFGSIIGICVTIIFVLGLVMLGLWIKEESKLVGLFMIIVTVIIGTAIIGGILIWQFRTESGARALKDQEINFNGGIERVLKVYDVTGNLIEKYEGKFDIETENASGATYIVFDDENGKRHIIYYTTATIIIDEK